MAIVLTWFRAFKLSWWRRCKSCSLRASKCMCSRPSMTIDHIFFLEERKNKYGARNFCHVSDTMVTTSSSASSNPLSSSGISVGKSFGDDYRAGDFYRSTQDQQQQLQLQQQQSQQVKVGSAPLVRKNVGILMPVTAGTADGDVYRVNQYDALRHKTRRQMAAGRRSSASSNSSIQVYSRRQPRLRTSGRSSDNSNNSLVVRSSNASSVRSSSTSDRLSIDCNMGSYNPRSRFFDGSYAPSILEDEEDSLDRLNGLLQLPSPASSTSTVLEHSRYHPIY